MFLLFLLCQGRSPEPEQEAAEASSTVLGGGVLVDQRFCVEHRHHSNHHRRRRRTLLLVRVLEQLHIAARLWNLVLSESGTFSSFFVTTWLAQHVTLRNVGIGYWTPLV